MAVKVTRKYSTHDAKVVIYNTSMQLSHWCYCVCDCTLLCLAFGCFIGWPTIFTLLQ